jgi:hypothetical protein
MSDAFLISTMLIKYLHLSNIGFITEVRQIRPLLDSLDVKTFALIIKEVKIIEAFEDKCRRYISMSRLFH